jgi:hypothetical protein
MRPIKIDKSLEYFGEQISYKVSGTIEQVQQLVKEYQPKRVIFTETSRYKDFDTCVDQSAFVQVYLLFEEEQAMLFRLSKEV